MRKYFMMLFVVSVLLTPFAAMAGARVPEPQISGEIEGGLRMLEVAQGSSDLAFTIFRGDYIVFNFADAKSHEFKVPALGIDQIMPNTDAEKPYVKMKKSGEFAFSLGARRGVFHVLELVSAHYQELTATEAVELINNLQPLIIDVRTPREYNAGHIPGANLLPVQLFAQHLEQLEQYRDEDILLYCASGNRSTVAAKMLIDAGFTRVYNLRKGFGDWERNSLPVE
jgi:rhodanese-related sulfurtransferase